MKRRRNARRFTALLLTVSMVCGMALSANAEGVEKTSTVPGDGVHDTWKQDPITVKNGTSGKNDAVVELTADNKLHLKSGTGNLNNGDGNPPPAVFLDDSMTTALAAASGNKTVSMKVTLDSSTANICFGIYVNYKEPGKGLFIGYNTMGGWFRQYYGGNGSYPSFTGPTLAKGSTHDIELTYNASTLVSFKVDGTALLTNDDYSNITDKLGVVDCIAVKVGTDPQTKGVTEAFLTDIHYPGQATIPAYDISGKVTDSKTSAGLGETAVKIDGKSKAVTNSDGTYSVTGLLDGTYTLQFEREGYTSATKEVTISAGNMTGQDVSLVAQNVNQATLSTAKMDVLVDQSFPRVIQYNMKGSLSGKTMYGQTAVLDTIRLNGKDIKPTVTSTMAADKATYILTAKDDTNHIDAVLTVVISVKDNILQLDIPKVVNNLNKEQYPIESIYFPNHSLVSVRNTQTGANLKGAAMSSHTQISGDEAVTVNASMPMRDRDYMYAYVSYDNGLSAGVESNTAYQGRFVSSWISGGVGAANTRVMATSKDMGAYQTMGLASAPFVYNYVLTGNTGRRYVMEPLEMPSEKIAIGGDENTDGTINWQDGAIAQRSVLHELEGSSEVPDLVSTRISMNFGGQAQNPFLTSLDNVKRVALMTDGLGQSILLKGYASEGHDSGHPDFGNIGDRIGGAEEMNTLLTEGLKYGARFGIHINASEMYPEAKAFSNELVKRGSDGGLSYGWNWLDQGVGIDGAYDLASGEREKRFDELFDKVGNNLDFIYLDVFGNGTSGDEASWTTRAVSQQVTSRGWRMSNEWGPGNEYDATFQHWAGDLTYGGAGAKGYNSEVMRFLRNHERDSWVADYPSYGGAANAPLLGGNTMKDFEGWQGRNDYDAYINNLYSFNLSTKFLQHYKVMKWVDGNSVSMGSYNWTPEMEITLKNDAGDTVVVTRGSNNPSDAAYRSRTMTLNGKTILQGIMSKGDWSGKGTESYLIPWIWDSTTGEKVATADEKLYHWNTKGGTTEWSLPDGWTTLSSVKVYKLTDQGKTDMQTVNVTDGKISLVATAETPYVICKGTEANLDVKWSEGMHLVDVGFNSGSLTNWTQEGTGTSVIAKSQFSNPMLKLTGEKTLTQTITDLKPGVEYAVYVGVDNRSEAKAYMTVKSGDTVLATNYSGKSIAKNYVKADTHNTNSATVDGNSYFQNMYVFFTAPNSGTVTLTLSRDAGKDDTYFDNIRVLENNSKNIVSMDDKGNVTRFEQNFENSAQGIYPFVIGPREGVEDNRTHLSELHDPYTQSGWDVKKLDDVLDGSWSLKTNGLTSFDCANGAHVNNSGFVYQTIPQNFRFQPGVTYTVSFDYQAGSKDTYAITYGNGEFRGNTPLLTLDGCIDTKGNTVAGTNTGTRQFSFNMTGAADGQSWFGVYITNTASEDGGMQQKDPNTGDSRINFGGYRDLILDNLVIEVATVQKAELEAAITTASSKYEPDYTADSWTVFSDALKTAKSVQDDVNATGDQVQNAVKALNDAMSGLVTIVGSLSGTITGLDNKPVEGAVVTLKGSNLLTAPTTTTDKDGKYSFENILVRNYSIYVDATGYETTFSSFTLVAGESSTKDFTMAMKAVSDYTNSFDNGNVSGFEGLTGDLGKVGVKPGSDNASMLLSFPGGHNNIVDTNSPLVKNGVFEADVTPVGSPNRFGFTLRGTDNTHRIFIGVGDSPNVYFTEYWGTNSPEASCYSGMSTGPVQAAGQTRHWKVQIEGNNVSLWIDGQQVMNNVALNKEGNVNTNLPIPGEAAHIGFECRYSAQFNVDNLEVTSNDAPPANTQNITGKVMDAAGNPLVNAVVKIYAETKGRAAGDPIATTRTNLRGEYTVKYVPYGTYNVTVSAEGYNEDIKTSVTVAAGGVTNAGESKLTLDASELQALYDAHKDDTQGNYTPKSFKALTDALAFAKTTLETATTAKEISAALDQLNTAVAKLTDKADRTALDAQIKIAEDMQKAGDVDKATQDAQNAFAKALADAKSANDDSSVDDVAKYTSALIAAIAGIKANPDKSDLQAAIDVAEALNMGGYIKNGQDKFRQALANAKATLENPTATAADIARDLKALTDSIANDLTAAADKSALKSLLDAIAKLDLSQYTKATADALREAVSAAQAILNNENIPASQQAAVDEMVKALQDAKNGLKPVDTTVPPTGDNTATTLVLVMLMLSVAGFIVFKRKTSKVDEKIS